MGKDCVNRGFTIDDSLAMKGIAIIMLMIHHNFRVAGLFKNYDVSFWPFNQEQGIEIAMFCRNCLYIFILITGYGLTKSLKAKNQDYKLDVRIFNKWIVERLIKLMSGFWFVFVLSCIFCQIMDGRTANIYFSKGLVFGIYQMIMDFFGLSRIFRTPMLNKTWWYMGAAIVFVFLVPLFNRIAKNYLGYAVSLFLTFVLPRLFGIGYMGDTTILPYFFTLFLGCTMAEYNLMERLHSFKLLKHEKINNVVKFFICTLLLIVAYKEYLVFFRLGNEIWEFTYGVVPFVLFYWCYDFIIIIPIIRDILIFLGRHSMNVFLTHTFIRGVYFSDFTYSFGHFLIISGILLAISVTLSIILERLKIITHYNLFIKNILKRIV